jgi:protease I
MSDSAALSGRRIAILVENDFEDSELTGPRDALKAAGATVVIVGPTANTEFKGKKLGTVVTSELAAGSANAKEFDAVVIPGGYAPDKMRMFEAGKPVAAICHAASMLISANAVKGKTLTCWPSVAIDVKNAGGMYVDKPVVEDGNLITSRKPDDIPFFNDAIIRALK